MEMTSSPTPEYLTTGGFGFGLGFGGGLADGDSDGRVDGRFAVSVGGVGRSEGIPPSPGDGDAAAAEAEWLPEEVPETPPPVAAPPITTTAMKIDQYGCRTIQLGRLGGGVGRCQPPYPGGGGGEP